MSAQAEATVKLSLIDRITNPIKKISARLSNLGKRIGFDRITRSVGNLGRSIQGLGTGLVRTTGRLTAFLGLLGAGGAGVIASAYGLAKSVADIGGEIDDTANRLKIGIEALQEWRYAARLSGVENASFDKGVEKLGINAVAAAKGNKQLASAFRSIGVRVKDAHGKMRPMDDVLDATMAALAGIKDPLKQNALAFQLFGKSGVVLTQMMADGAGGMKDLRSEARRLGIVLGTSAVKAGAEFGDQTDRLAVRLTSLKYLVGAQLLPVFNEAIQALTDWYDANKVLIRSTLTGWVKNLVSVIKALADPTSDIRQQFSKFGETVSGLVNKIKPFVDFIGGPMNAALGLIGFWVLAPTISAVTLLALAFGKLGTSVAGLAINGLTAFTNGVTSFAGQGLAASMTGAGSKAGSLFGKAFTLAARALIIAAIAGITMDALQEVDPKGNLGGFTKPLDDYLRKKLGLSAKDTGITPNEIWEGIFGRKGDKASEKANSVAPEPQPRLSPVARNLGFDQSPVFGGSQRIANSAKSIGSGLPTRSADQMPGKAKDDLTSPSKPEMVMQNSNNTTTVTVNSPVSVSISGLRSDDTKGIASAINRALEKRDRQVRDAFTSSMVRDD
ncbi:hypothetical protein J5277_16395 [Rhizobium sp. 16-449-1b]|uniref:hypothetical protein n=1 Tax=Rhizobium sp. 16-449-1b TaxID=2819989 RepID=UPI001ADACA72|nr:hypothetical protein [Rhizobium sp. 16-449-1b]MBO9195687.1 hypothetical protein [Rhizobium sp. 16-449-1b]